MSLAEKVALTAEEYLHGEETADIKHEFQNGDVWAMVGATDSHVTIAGNLFLLLKTRLKGSPCRAYISDMKLRVEKANAFFYPDVMVTCNAKDQASPLYKANPLFIAEILSPSTEAFDRGAKFNAYRQLDSLQTYWLIDAQNQQIDSFTRTENNGWLLHSYTKADERIEVSGMDVACLLSEIYDDVLW